MKRQPEVARVYGCTGTFACAQRFLIVTVSLAALALLSGCFPSGGTGGGGSYTGIVNYVPPDDVIGPTGGTADPDGGPPVNLTVTGGITYDRLPVTLSGLGATPMVENAVNVQVEAVAHDDITNVLATTSTDANGEYSLNLMTDRDYFIRARSQAGEDSVYHSATRPNILHAIPGKIRNRAAGNPVVDLHGAYDLPDNRAGAFAILDTVRRLREEVSGSFASLGPLDVFWDVGNQGSRYVVDAAGRRLYGMVVGTHPSGRFGNPSIYLLASIGDPAFSDHDEFDETVIAHEWASFLLLTQSRDNNFGGRHAGEELIYSASYSEGVVTAIGNGLLGEPVYRDTVGWPTSTTGVQFALDCESGTVPGTGVGYGNEFEMTRAAWDLLDGGAGWPADNDGDPAAVDMGDFFASLTALKSRGAPYEVAWMASLLQQLIDDGHLTQAAADTVMQAHGAQFPPPGGDAFPEWLTLGVAQNGSLDAYSGINPNPILGPQANGVWRLEVFISGSYTISLTNTVGNYDDGSHRLDLSVYDLERNILAIDEGIHRDKIVNVSLSPGTYVVRVFHWPVSPLDSAPTTYSLLAQ